MEDSKKSRYRPGAYIYIEGDEDSDEIFIIEEGEIKLHSVNEQIQKYKSVLTDGEIFGFTSSLCKRPRMESAIALKPTVIIALKRERFLKMVQANPSIAMKIINYFSQELDAYNDMIGTIEEVEKNYYNDEMSLFNLGEYYLNKSEFSHAGYIFSRYLEHYPDGTFATNVRSMSESMDAKDLKPGINPVVDGAYKVYEDQQMVFSEFEPGRELYIIKEGKVKIVKVFGENEVLLSVLKEGDIFGELSIVSLKSRNATAISWGKSVLLPIMKESLVPVLKKSPAIVNKIFMAISQRIWFTFIRVEAKLYIKPITRIYVFLENKLLEDRIPLKSTQSITFPFGIDELLRMAGTSPAHMGDSMNVLLADTNLNYNFGQTTIENPSVLSHKARFYRSRDHLGVSEETADYSDKAAHELVEKHRERIAQEMIEEKYDPPQKEKPENNGTGLTSEDLRAPSDDLVGELEDL